MRLIALLAFCAVGFVAQPSLAQGDDEIELTRAVISAKKKLIVAQNMGLKEEQKPQFWSIYGDYQQALAKLDARDSELITEYAKAYDDLSNEVARRLLKEALAVDRDRLTLQETYLKRFATVLSPKQVARYYQIENKLFAVVSYELAKVVPLVK